MAYKGFDLTGKVSLVTGGNGGIGFGMADAMAEAGADVIEPGLHLALIALSRGGADATVVREFDMETRQFVEDGFNLPEAKSSVTEPIRTEPSWAVDLS